MNTQLSQQTGVQRVMSPGARLLVLNTVLFALAVALLVGPQLVAVPAAGVSREVPVASRQEADAEAGVGCVADSCFPHSSPSSPAPSAAKPQDETGDFTTY